MAWFKVDDKLHASRKVMKIPRRHRLAAVGLWTIAGSWCADQETDGIVPDYMIEEWGGTKLLVDQLVSVGLWLQLDHNPVATGSQLDCNWEFHNWGEYQPTRAQLEDGRRKNAEKLRKWRERNQDVTGDVTGLQDGSNHDRNPAPDPTRPGPSPIEEAKASSSLSKRGTRIDPAWIPDADLIQQMREECPGVDLEGEHRKFVDHWIAQPGQKGVKLDWPATWRNWIRRAQPQRAAQGGKVTAGDKARSIADEFRKEGL